MLRIEQVLYEQGISQSKAARLADVNQTSFSRIIRGKEPAYSKRGQRIADAIGWTGNWQELFEEVDNNASNRAVTATDELRRLLDERGVEYKDRDMFGKHVFHWGEPLHGAMFTDGGEWTELVVENATPEQAVEATLGSDLKAENAKLRELLDYITPIAWHAASENERDRMRELGVEV